MAASCHSRVRVFGFSCTHTRERRRGQLRSLSEEGSSCEYLAASADEVEDDGCDSYAYERAADGLCARAWREDGLTRAVRTERDKMGRLLFVERELFPVLFLELFERFERLFLLDRCQALP